MSPLTLDSRPTCINPTALRPRHRATSDMRLPSQLNDPQPIPRRLGPDADLRPPAHGIGDVLVVPPIPPRQARVLTDVQPARGVERLGRGVELARRRQRAPDARVLGPEVGVRRGLARRRDRPGFLRATPELERKSVSGP